jgi:hypothetical protein
MRDDTFIILWLTCGIVSISLTLLIIAMRWG